MRCALIRITCRCVGAYAVGGLAPIPIDESNRERERERESDVNNPLENEIAEERFVDAMNTRNNKELTYFTSKFIEVTEHLPNTYIKLTQHLNHTYACKYVSVYISFTSWVINHKC